MAVEVQTVQDANISSVVLAFRTLDEGGDALSLLVEALDLLEELDE